MHPLLLARIGVPGLASAGNVRLCFSPRGPATLAVGTGSTVVMIGIPTASAMPITGDMSALAPTFTRTIDAALVPSATMNQGAVVDLCFSPEGDRLAAVSDGGNVYVWSIAQRMDGALMFGDLLVTFRPHVGALCLAWVPVEGAASALATLSDDGLELHVWDLGHDAIADGLRPAQSLLFTSDGPEPAEDFHGALMACPGAQLLLVLSSSRKLLHAVRLGEPGPEAASLVVFECVTQFPVASGVHSLALAPASGEEDRLVRLVAYMPSGLQYFDLDVDMFCTPPPLGAEEAAATSTATATGQPSPSARASDSGAAARSPSPPPASDLLSLLRNGAQQPLPVEPSAPLAPLVLPEPPTDDGAEEEPLDAGTALLNALRQGPLARGTPPVSDERPESPPPPPEPTTLPSFAAFHGGSRDSPAPEPSTATAAFTTPGSQQKIKVLKRPGSHTPLAVAGESTAASSSAVSPRAEEGSSYDQMVRLMAEASVAEEAAAAASAGGKVGAALPVDSKRKIDQMANDVKNVQELIKSLRGKVEETGKAVKAQQQTATSKEDVKKAAAAAVQQQVAFLSQELRTAVAQAVKQEVKKAVEEVLPKLLPQVIGDVVRTQFTQKVVPAFEAASRQMLEQLQSSVLKGMEEYIQVGLSPCAAGPFCSAPGAGSKDLAPPFPAHCSPTTSIWPRLSSGVWRPRPRSTRRYGPRWIASRSSSPSGPPWPRPRTPRPRDR